MNKRLLIITGMIAIGGAVYGIATWRSEPAPRVVAAKIRQSVTPATRPASEIAQAEPTSSVTTNEVVPTPSPMSAVDTTLEQPKTRAGAPREAIAQNSAGRNRRSKSPAPANAPAPEPDKPIARQALTMVGADPVAEQIWFTAINDPNTSAHDRQDLIEDLNEEGFDDPKNLTTDDLPLIESRIALIETLAPGSMDEINAAAFVEAYKDLINMHARVSGQ